MGNRQAKTIGAVGAGLAALVVAVGWSTADATATTAMSTTAASSSATPAPAPGGAIPVQPAGGGGCIIGLNCGCVHNCHNRPPPRPPGDAGDPQHAAPAPAPQNP